MVLRSVSRRDREILGSSVSDYRWTNDSVGEDQDNGEHVELEEDQRYGDEVSDAQRTASTESAYGNSQGDPYIDDSISNPEASETIIRADLLGDNPQGSMDQNPTDPWSFRWNLSFSTPCHPPQIPRIPHGRPENLHNHHASDTSTPGMDAEQEDNVRVVRPWSSGDRNNSRSQERRQVFAQIDRCILRSRQSGQGERFAYDNRRDM